MLRLRITKLTVSHRYIHKRLDDFGKDHDADIMECVALESKRLQVRCLKAEGQNSREEKPQMQKDTNAQSDADASHRIMASWEKLKWKLQGKLRVLIEQECVRLSTSHLHKMLLIPP